MKKLYRIIIIVAIIIIILVNWYIKYKNIPTQNSSYNNEKFISSQVIATVIKDGRVYLDDEFKDEIWEIYKGDEVEILKDRGMNIYYIKSDEYKIKGWVSKDILSIPKTPYTNTEYIQNSEIEKYINDTGIQSDTKHLIFTDIYRQQTHVLKGREGNWKVVRSIKSSTGENKSPTTRGVYKIGEKGTWFYSERLKIGAMYWVRFNEAYLFHSLPMDKNQVVIDDTLGQRCSHGCVRMGIDDIKWFYENIETGSTVFIN